MLRVFASRTLQTSLFRSRMWFSTAPAAVNSVPRIDFEAPTAAEAPEKSKRQQFREMNIDRTVLGHLDSIRLGYLGKPKHRRAIARKINNNQIQMESIDVGDSYSKHTPFPFKAKGKLIHHAFSWDYIPHRFEGDPSEVALIGRSNVGKSTLLNALVGFDTSYVQKADMSHRPGETKQLAFYQIGSVNPKYEELEATTAEQRHERQLVASSAPSSSSSSLAASQLKSGALVKSADGGFELRRPKVILQQKPKTPALVLVDMPGYGFSFSKAEDKERMRLLAHRYLMSNIPGGLDGSITEKAKVKATAEDLPAPKPLKRVLLLLDARHGMKMADVAFFDDLYKSLAAEHAHLREAALTPEEVVRLQRPKNYINTNTPTTSNMAITEEMVESIREEKFQQKLKKLLGWKLQVVVTKCDLLERLELCRQIQVIKSSVESKLNPVFHNSLPIVVLSGHQKRGLHDLQNELAELVPAEARDRMSDKELKWLAIREERKTLHLKKLKATRTEKEKQRALDDLKAKKAAVRLAAKAAKAEADAAFLLANPPRPEEDHKGVAGLFKERPEGDGEQQEPRRPRGPSPTSKTAHLTPKEYKFRLLHEKPLHPSPVPALDFGPAPTEEVLGEEEGVSRSSSSSSDLLMTVEAIGKTTAQDAASVKRTASGNRPSAGAAKSEESVRRGRRQRPLVTRVGGVTTFAEVAEEYDAPLVLPSKREKTGTRAAAGAAAAASVEEEEEADPISEAMLRKAAANAEVIQRQQKAAKKERQQAKRKEQLETKTDDENESFTITRARRTNTTAHHAAGREEEEDRPGYSSEDPSIYGELNPHYARFKQENVERELREGTAKKGKGGAVKESSQQQRSDRNASKKQQEQQHQKDKPREGRRAAAVVEEEFDEDEGEWEDIEDVDDEEEERRGAARGRGGRKGGRGSVNEEGREKAEFGLNDSIDFTEQDFADMVSSTAPIVHKNPFSAGTGGSGGSKAASASASGTLTASAGGGALLSRRQLRMQQHALAKERNANGTPYTDEELYQHASTEGFTTSAYDDEVVVGGRAIKPIIDPITGAVVKPFKLNRKQKRLKRQAKEKLVKEGLLYE